MINSNWHPISYRFGVIAVYCSNFGYFAFLSHPFGGLSTTYDVHLGLNGKRVVDFLLVLIEVFFTRCYGWVATSEEIANRRCDFAQTRSLWSKISGRRGRPPPIIFARLVRPINALQLCRWRFSHRNFVADFLQAKCDFVWKSAVLRFETPFEGLRAAYVDHLRLIGKRVVDFLLVLLELFSLGVTAEEHRANIGWNFAPTGASWPKISGRRGRPHQPFFFSEN